MKLIFFLGGMQRKIQNTDKASFSDICLENILIISFVGMGKYK